MRIPTVTGGEGLGDDPSYPATCYASADILKGPGYNDFPPRIREGRRCRRATFT